MTLSKLAVRNITSKPSRFLLTSLAVLVGVALTSAVFVFTDSLRKTFGDLSQDIESGYDVAVRSEIPFGDRLRAAPVDLSIPDLLLKIDGVLTVQPRVIEFGVVPNRATGVAATAKGPNIGVNWESEAQKPRLFPVSGRAPTNQNEFAIDVDAARSENFVVGNSYEVQTPVGILKAKLVGTFSFADPEENALVGAMLVAFDLETAVAVLNDGKGYDDITLTITKEAGVTAAIADALPEGLEVIDRDVLAAEQADEFNQFINIFRTILLVFAFVILLVAAFIIYNVFSIIVGQRMQEIGLLRALGATGKQITQSIAMEAFLVGLFATVVGLLLGVPIAAGLQTLLASLDFGPEDNSTPVRLTTVIVAVILGIGLTMSSAISPALRARRVPPIAAIRQEALVNSGIVPKPLLGGLLTSVGVLLVTFGFLSDDYLLLMIFSSIAAILLHLGMTRIHPLLGRFALIGLATALVIVALTANLRASMLLGLLGTAALSAFLGMNVLSPLFAAPASRALGAPIGKLGVPGKLARENASRNPRRTATAASALMIGLALVTAVAVIAESFKSTFADILQNAVTADWIVLGEQGGPNGGGFSRAVATDLEQLPQIEAVLSVQWINSAFRTRVDQNVRTVYATDLTEIERHIDLDFVAKDTSLFASNAVLIHNDDAGELDINVGDNVEVEFVNQSVQKLTVAGIFSDLGIFDSGWVVATDLWSSNKNLPTPQDRYVTMIQAEDVSIAEARIAIQSVTDNFSQLNASTKDEYQKNQEKQVDRVLIVINILLLLSVVLALLGVAITLALSVFERTREIGITRAVGATRQQIKRMVRGEGIIVALFGGVLGIGLGLLFGIACVQIIPDDFVKTLSIPWDSLIIYLGVATLAGLVAAYFPARRAAKLDVLDAISHGD